MIDRIELVRHVPYAKLSKEDQKGMKKSGYALRTVIVHLDGIPEDVKAIKALVLQHSGTDWTAEE